MNALKHIGTVVVMLGLGLMAGCSATVEIHGNIHGCMVCTHPVVIQGR